VSTKPPPAAPAPVATKPRVLVIDDEEMICVTLMRVLGGPYVVESTIHASEAIARIARGERYDVILCDLSMPEKSGAEVHAAIEAIDPPQAARTMFLTGGAFNAKGEAFLERQKNPVIAKPFAVDELIARIEQVLARRR
jgi:CheY-like chemotaxis protein